jgi:predicted ATP-grasp superfamily ATP-dependent carboligase
MELLERAYGRSVFGTHANACEASLLPQFDLQQSRYAAPAVGKAIVFAQSEVVVGDTGGWLADANVRDVPQVGELIRTGAPVCTVFAEGQDISDCHAALVARAEGVYALLAGWKHGST